jgi:hypothetical protein
LMRSPTTVSPRRLQGSLDIMCSERNREWSVGVVE